eukprot:755714-Rhodomonas_salina.2
MDPRDATPDGRLPDADKGSSKANIKHLRTIFGRMGLSDQVSAAISYAGARYYPSLSSAIAYGGIGYCARLPATDVSGTELARFGTRRL